MTTSEQHAAANFSFTALHTDAGECFGRPTMFPAPLLQLSDDHANFFASEHPFPKVTLFVTSSFCVHNRAPIEVHAASASSNRSFE